jgi:N-acylneuraminate cytidylyltransferase
MKIAIEIPLKARPSERVPGKNFRPLAGRPLFAWLLGELLRLELPVDLFIDSEDPAVFAAVRQVFPVEPLEFHQRHAWLSGDEANGNHLLHQFAVLHPAYDLYLQAFVTAVALPARVIDAALRDYFNVCNVRDSFFLATAESGFLWYRDRPVNYDPTRPAGLPRTQDAPLLRETTGLYGIRREALFRTGCRLGDSPWPILVDRRYAVDIDTPEDFAAAERILSMKSPHE